jgi:hypothetical protein
MQSYGKMYEFPSKFKKFSQISVLFSSFTPTSEYVLDCFLVLPEAG